MNIVINTKHKCNIIYKDNIVEFEFSIVYCVPMAVI